MSKYDDIRLNRTNIRNLNRRVAMNSVDKVTEQVETAAKLATLGAYSTGDLAASIHRNTYMQDRTAVGWVGTFHPKADLIHDGAVPHPIHPIAPDGTMVFYWRKVGHVVRFKRPHIRMHPGMTGKRFLSGPLERIGRRHRYIVFTYGH